MKRRNKGFNFRRVAAAVRPSVLSQLAPADPRQLTFGAEFQPKPRMSQRVAYKKFDKLIARACELGFRLTEMTEPVTPKDSE